MIEVYFYFFVFWEWGKGVIAFVGARVRGLAGRGGTGGRGCIIDAVAG